MKEENEKLLMLIVNVDNNKNDDDTTIFANFKSPISINIKRIFKNYVRFVHNIS